MKRNKRRRIKEDEDEKAKQVKKWRGRGTN
jgi:hypothetical protein